MNAFPFFIAIGVALLAMMVPVLYRSVSGPTVIDRMIGLNIIGTKTTVLLVVIGTLYDRVDMFVDLALTYAILNFLSSLAAARYLLHRGRAREAARAMQEVTE